MVDLTVAAIPGFVATMAGEYVALRRRAERNGPSPVDYTGPDTAISLLMGLGSLVAPLVMPKLLEPVTPFKGKYGKWLVGAAAASVAVSIVADRIAREPGGPSAAEAEAEAAADADADPRVRRRAKLRRLARKVAGASSVAAVATGGTAITTTWTQFTSANRLWERRILPDLGNGPLAWTTAMLGWDLIYYWNHRFMHESRYMWAIHVVHHSSEHYNLSTALRQTVADAFGTYVPYGVLSLLGVRPHLIVQARALNLIYQYWIHSDLIPKLGPFEEVFNTASHHRVHHGTNSHYIDRNHGSILILWDRLFGTFQREDEPVVYGLTKNINTYNPLRVISHEHADMLGEVYLAPNWSDRLSFVLRGPGWAYAHRDALPGRGADEVVDAELAGAGAGAVTD